MDLVTHALSGVVFSQSKKYSRFEKAEIIFWSVFPDIGQIPQYLFLGFLKDRSFYLPWDQDWSGFPESYPLMWLLWVIPHCLGLFLLIAPFFFILKRPKMGLFAYFFHLVFDMFTHTGEFSMQLFYPLPYKFVGYSDAWKWPVHRMFLIWGVIILGLLIYKRVRKH